MLEPVTESLVVHWPPTARYFLQRLDFLAAMEDEKLIREFRVTPDEIAVRTDSAQLTMTERGLFLQPRGSVTADDPMHLLRSAFACASPLTYHYFLTYQYLIPVTNSYDGARQDALKRLSLGHLAASDFSIQVDGAVGEDDWHCEFGIVSESEVEPRLRRLVGRMSRYGGLPEFVAIPADIAPVSFFADFVWKVPPCAGRKGESSDDIAKYAHHLAGQAEGLVSQMYSQICDSLQSVGGSEP